jgi:iron complex outermembrane recepter protein
MAYSQFSEGEKMSQAAVAIRRRTPRRTLLSSAVAALACSGFQALHAQEATAPPAAAASAAGTAAGDGQTAKVRQAVDGTDDKQSVVVTATRRREPSREVPMQVNVLSTGDLQKVGAKTLSDYLANEPGVEVKTTGGAGLGAISIRGVSTGDQTSNTVGAYIDDVAVGSSTAFGNGATNAIDMALLDLNHIELLRGPQGTLYGAGAMGGVLKYVTNEPDTYELSGSISLGVSFTRRGAPSNTESAIVNVPLKEDVAGLRVSAFTDREGGYVDAVGPAARKNANGGRTSGGRLSVLIEPSNHFKVRLTETAQVLRRDGTDVVDYDITTGRPYDPLTGSPVGRSQRTLMRPEPYELKVAVTGADLEYDLGWARLNAITSVQQTRYDVSNDLSIAYVPQLVAAGVPAESAGINVVSEVRKTSQEFRLTSKGGGAIEWIGGLWWDHESATNNQDATETLQDGSAGPALLEVSLPSTYREVAGYGDLTWNATKSFALTGGIRVARNQQKFSERGPGGLLSAPADTSSTSAETAKTYLVTAKYALTPTSNAYVRAASGYRPGGPNFVVFDPVTGLPGAPLTFQHDSLWSYEGGYKADLLDRTLNVEASLYDIKWHNIQQYFTVDGVSVIVNSGDADIKGAELAATWKPSAKVSLTGSLAFINAKLSKTAEGLGTDGTRLPNSARVAGAVAARYSFDIGESPAYIGLSERFSGERNAGFEGSESLPNYRLPSFALTDLQAGADYKKISLALFVRNLFDRRAQVSAQTGNVPLGGPVWVTEERPRELGLTLSSTF